MSMTSNMDAPNSNVSQMKRLNSAVETVYEDPLPENGMEVLSVFDSMMRDIYTDSPDEYEARFNRYYAGVSNAVAQGFLREGWQNLTPLFESFPPSDSLASSYPAPGTIVLGNTVARMVVDSQQLAGGLGISPKAMQYLWELRDQDNEYTRSLSVFVGWGVSQPTTDIQNWIQEVVSMDPSWVRSVLKHAFLANQEAAADLFGTVLRMPAVQEASGEKIVQGVVPTVEYLSFVIGSLEYSAGEDSVDAPTGMPELPEFNWDSDVKQRVSKILLQEGVLSSTDSSFEPLIQ